MCKTLHSVTESKDKVFFSTFQTKIQKKRTHFLLCIRPFYHVEKLKKNYFKSLRASFASVCGPINSLKQYAPVFGDLTALTILVNPADASSFLRVATTFFAIFYTVLLNFTMNSIFLQVRIVLFQFETLGRILFIFGRNVTRHSRNA